MTATAATAAVSDGAGRNPSESSGLQSTSVQAHSPSLQMHLLQPSLAVLSSPC